MKKGLIFILIAALLLVGCGRRAPAVVPDIEPDVVIDPIDPQPFPGPEPTPAPPLKEEKVAEIKMLTYNVWGLPWPFGKNVKNRMEMIGPTLQQYDIVALQEAFSGHAKILAETAAFPYQEWHRKKKAFKMKASGLFIMSKFPIIKKEFLYFKNCTSYDCMDSKGVLFIRVKHPELGPVDIYNTHYQSENTPTGSKIRLTDNNKAMQTIYDHNKSIFPVVLMGDFNMLPGSPEYVDLKARMKLHDIFREKNPEDPGYTYDPSQNKNATGVDKERLDYIFVPYKNHIRFMIKEAKLAYNQAFDDVMPSDHFGVSSTIEFRVPVIQPHPDQGPPMYYPLRRRR